MLFRSLDAVRADQRTNSTTGAIVNRVIGRRLARLARSGIADYLRALDVFVLPSLNEGISNTILEAMATGLPVIATDVGGNPELLTPDTGKLVPRSDPLAMAQAMKDYLDSADLLRAHGTAGRRRTEETFSLSVMTERYLSVYDKLLGR